MKSAAPLGHTQGQRQEPHGGQGSGGGGDPGRTGKTCRRLESEKATSSWKKKDCTVKAGVCGRAFSTGRDHVNRGQEAEHAVRSRDGWRGGLRTERKRGDSSREGNPEVGGKGGKAIWEQDPSLLPTQAGVGFW